MDDNFNPYAQWLGLPETLRQPNHYQLLGLAPFESDASAIKLAADRSTTRVRSYRPGDKARHWARLLDELDQARKCLGDSEQKRVYDEQLLNAPATVESPAPNAAQYAAPSPLMPPAPMPEQPRYGPAGPPPDNAASQVAGPVEPASRFAPGFDASAVAETAEPAIPQPGSYQQRPLPMSAPGRAPASPSPQTAPATIYAGASSGASADPMAPYDAGAQSDLGHVPATNPMAPLAAAAYSGASTIGAAAHAATAPYA
ncbi:MAG: hypothetical protein KDA41_12575, partial [Planctomycetales bacterium]|nr:hypothetical protein [Planctomycetales bacterium]